MLSTLVNLAVIILGFSVLIFVHELGHFLAAKWAGIRTEGFAIGMGPAIVSYRRGVGLRIGSTHDAVVRRTGKAAIQLGDEELAAHGIGETEYSLRCLPIGGFVKMLGQEDLNPSAVSADPRSYGRCSVAKRMVVVSAGVVMNLITAAACFIVAFLMGVDFLAPVIGGVQPGSPAATTVARDADAWRAMGIDPTGMREGDRVVSVDGEAAETFADLQIASAMGRPDRAIELVVDRRGASEPMVFDVVPVPDANDGLLTLGVAPAYDTTLHPGIDDDPTATEAFRNSGLPQQGVEPGMTVLEVGGRPIEHHADFEWAVAAAARADIDSTWAFVDEAGEPVGEPVTATIDAIRYQTMRDPDQPDGSLPELGVLGLLPLIQIERVVPGTPNTERLRAGDVILSIAGRPGPRFFELRAAAREHAGETMAMRVLRDGEPIDLEVEVAAGDSPTIGFMHGDAWETPVLARSIDRRSGEDGPVPTAAAGLDLLPLSRVIAIDDRLVADWNDLIGALVASTSAARAADEGATVRIELELPTPGRDREILEWTLGAADVRTLHELPWRSTLDPGLFDLVSVTRSAGGDPIRALRMGVDETIKLVLMTYLTIDRLVRGSVPVEQVQGPVGIVHLGSEMVDRGFTYLLFFFAIISVNLAVINFLPLPIVDGGLFLFLVYEKIRGEPPSIAFQNIATLVGLVLIGTVFVVVTWNDVGRLLG